MRFPLALVRLSALTSIALAGVSVYAQQPPAPAPKSPTPTPAPKTPAPAPPTGPAKPADAKPAETKPPVKPGTPKPYKEVITAEAKTEKGMFTVHRIDDKIFFEIPVGLLERDMLWQTEIAQTGNGVGFGGTHVGEKLIKFTRRNNTIYMRGVNYSIRGDGKTAIQKSVDISNVAPILAAFPVEAEGEGKAAVINVTRFYLDDTGPIPASGALGGGVDPTRSYIERVKAYPANIEGHSVLTLSRGGAVTAVAHYSLVLLPEKPMSGRFFDQRVGYFTEGFSDYGTDEHRVVDREFVARYRLEKKDPNARISDPVKPIVYYVSREVPEKWRKYIKEAIEDWQPAFEQSGFSHAIIAKDAPTEAEDPNWDPEDARYSVIRWVAEPIENAMGPHVHDPRSGEILSAHVIVWHNMLKLAEQWYFAQCADLDPRAKKLPLPDDLEGELVRYVLAHEVGHTLGLRHNHKASSSYTVAQLRDKAFTEKFGDEASIMDYGRFNYVAQPGDNAYLVPKIGPYDKFAIEWGYTSIPGAKTPNSEKSVLDAIAGRQALDPTLRFGGEDAIAQVDPTVQMEDLSNDAVAAGTLGLKNIERIVPMLIPATTKFGESYDQLAEVYGQLRGQRLQEMMHVAKLVGGVTETRYHAGRGEDVFTPVPRDRQIKAVQFLVKNAFYAPTYMYPTSIINKIQITGVTDRILAEQSLFMLQLLSDSRISRLLEKQTTSKTPTYKASELVADVQTGVWAELDSKTPVIDIYRRNLQRAYLKSIQPRLMPGTTTQNDLRPILRASIISLKGKVAAALATTKDDSTKLHLSDCAVQIDGILNPKFAPADASASRTVFSMFAHLDEMLPEARKASASCDLCTENRWIENLLGEVHNFLTNSPAN